MLAFSTADAVRRHPPAPGERTRTVADLTNDEMSAVFAAVVEATEEAIYNSLFTAETTLGKKGRRVEALPVERVVKGWRRGRIAGH